MMNVTEKLNYLQKRKVFQDKRKTESGITEDVLEVLRQRKMTTQDLDYLPACEIKDILQGSKKNKA